MSLEFYNDNLKKIVYSENGNELDLSNVKLNCNLIDGNEYVCKTSPDNPTIVTECFPLKSMSFEIRNVTESSTFENTYSCSVRVLSYEEGREYPNTDNVVVVGYFYNAYPESVYDTFGYWDVGKDGREIFYITEREQIISSSENSIKKYLSSLLKGKSVGKAIITRIIDECGSDTLERIKAKDPYLLQLVKNQKKLDIIFEEVNKSTDSERSLNFLVQNNIDAETAINIINKLGSTSYNQLMEDPFVLLKFNNISIERVNMIATKLGADYKASNNIDGLIIRYIRYRTATFGDIFVDKSDFIEQINGFSKFELFYDRYKQYPKFSHKEIDDALNRLIQENKIVKTCSIEEPEKDLIYEAVYYNMEKFIVDKLKSFQNEKPKAYMDEFDVQMYISEVEQDSITLDSIQKIAVCQAFSNKLSIISGGPGTGKTFVTKMIVDAFRTFFPDLKIQLCAPTGKASRRMSDVIGLPACTIHKKLGYGTGQNLPIEEDLLIIDECSMMDIDLFYKTLSAVGDNTTIVLVGDYNQLPSVGPGLILRDLIDSDKIPATILKSVFRQTNGSEIINAANAVLDKRIHDINHKFGKDFVFVEQTSKQEIYENLAGSIKYLIDSGVESNRIQLLTPQNEGLLGTTGLNNLMRDLCNPIESRGIGILIRNTMFFPGDRIIETENNSELGIFNGSMGTIIRLNKDEVVADFDGRTVVISKKDMSTIKLGYAITVHKSQGSEFDFVMMPIINEHEFTLNKNLLYTGITRAKKMFVLFGQKDALDNTIQKEIVWDRKSQIKSKLIKDHS